MNGEQVERLEAELETAIARVVRRMLKDGHLPEPQSHRVFHLMAKAAVAVFEAVTEGE